MPTVPSHEIVQAVQGCYGNVHGVNSGETTWHGFAKAIAGFLGTDIDIRKVSSEEFPRPARRPGYSVLDTTRLSTIIGRSLPMWDDALARYLETSCAS